MPTTAIGVMSSAHRYLQQAIQQKSEKLSFLASVPPQGVAYTRTEGRRTNNPWTWFAIGFDFLSKSCLTSQTYFKEPYLHVVLLPTKSLGDHL